MLKSSLHPNFLILNKGDSPTSPEQQTGRSDKYLFLSVLLAEDGDLPSSLRFLTRLTFTSLLTPFKCVTFR